jgi:hypothetical protein
MDGRHPRGGDRARGQNPAASSPRARRGTSGLHRAGWWVTPTRGDPRFPDNSDYPKSIIKGFYKFCQQYAFNHLLVSDLDKEKIHKGTCYINLAEDDLVRLLDKIIHTKLVIGKDVGVISYNETTLKKFILNGITTISTDFEYMGKSAAQLIKDGSKESVEVPFYLTVRASL